MVSRRETLRWLFQMSGSLVAASAGDVAAPTYQSPVITYPAMTGAEHGRQVAALPRQGYRPISLSVYGDPRQPRYAAVWVRRPGPAWLARHGLTVAEFQSLFDQWTSRGYVLTLISATGAASEAVVAAVFERRSAAGWLVRLALSDGDPDDRSSLQGQNRSALAAGLILSSAAVYGTPEDRRYAAVWLPNDQKAQWECHDDAAALEYRQWADVMAQMPYRPALLALSPDKRCLSVFRNDAVGEWVAKPDLTAEDYQRESVRQQERGLFPISLQGGGSGDGVRYAAIFARRDVAPARQWTITGNSAPRFAAFDAAVRVFMAANGVHAGTLAILKNGDRVFAHGYTWAEPGYSEVQPSSVFRLASCSKAFTCAAIYRLSALGHLDLSARVFPLLGLTPAADARLNDVTVAQLVDHTGGWDQATAPDPFTPGGVGLDPVFHIRDIARALGLTRPPTSREVAQYMMGQPLQSPPGSASHYSNFGYLLLGLVIEQVSGQTYIEYLRQAILAPLGIAEDVFVARTERDGRLDREVSYDQNGVGLSPLFPAQSVLVPFPYGGEGYMTEVMAAGGGLAATATALAQLAHHYRIWGLGLRLETGDWSLARSGAMAGTSSLAASRGKDGVDYAYIFNTRDFTFVPDALTTLDGTLGKLCDSLDWS